MSSEYTPTGKTVFIEWSNTRCEVFKSVYPNDRVALILYDTEEDCDYATATTNLPDEDVPEGHAFIKDYSENEGVLDALLAAGVVDKPIRYVHSGFVGIPLCKILV